MIEEYFFNFSNSNFDLHEGKYVQLIYNEQLKQYGELSANFIKKQVINIFYNCQKLNNNSKHRNVLLIGKVQSGKTSNLEMFTALAFDNGFRCVIIYGGYDSKLLKQTIERFSKHFNIHYPDDVEEDIPALFSTDNDSIWHLNEQIIIKCKQKNKPIVIISMKNYKALENINNILPYIVKNDIKTFIIDDEGDQASLNTEYKKNKESATYNQIKRMIEILNYPLYLSVTATPQANVLLGEYSELKPQRLFLIEPGNNYVGSEFFHLNDDSHICFIDEDDVKQLENEKIPDSLRNAIKYFLIGSIFLKNCRIEKSQMIIHTERAKIKHQFIYDFVYRYIKHLQDNDEEIVNLKNIYNQSYFSSELLKKSFDDLKDDLIDVIKNTNVVLQNSEDISSQSNANWYQHNIYIGGDLLQRGLTFNYLICTYFTRWPKKQGNMDTISQRARWFGYRSNYLDLCKVFTTKTIYFEYAALAATEKDLWDQCYKIQDGTLSIDDIIIDSTNSSLNPTRKNVVDWNKVKFHTKWNNQKYGIFNKNVIDKNNLFLDNFLNRYQFSSSVVGRTQNNKYENPTCYYTFISKQDALDLIKNVDEVFLEDPFDNFLQKTIESIDNEKIIIEKMFGNNLKQRIRTFDKDTCRISALQQGADSVDKNLQKYEGDASVIVNSESIIFQIFKIIPQFEKEKPLSEYTQYMFSIYFPIYHQGFKRKKDI